MSTTAASAATPATSAPAAYHPDLSAIAPLIGVWTGSGTGTYPTIAPFEYTESITFTCPNPARPVLSYAQSTAIHGRAAHSESGYWKVGSSDSGAGGRRLECVVAQVTGLAEVEEGLVVVDEAVGVVVDVRTVGLSRTSTAKAPHVREIRRVWRLSERGGQLEYEVWMATDNTPKLTLHLEAQFTKQQQQQQHR